MVGLGAWKEKKRIKGVFFSFSFEWLKSKSNGLS